MKLTYKNPIELSKILGAISNIVNEVNLNFDENGFSIFGLDSSHVSMIFLTIDKTDCIQYSCEIPIKLGVNLKTLTSVLGTGKENDQVTIENVNTDSLIIIIENQNRKIEYEIKLMEIQQDELFIPEMEYRVKLNTTASYFYGLLESISVIISDEVRFNVNDGKMAMSGSGQLGNTKIDFLNSNEVPLEKEYKLECEIENLELSFALVFVQKSKKLGDISKNIEIMIDEDAPIQIKYRIGQKSDIKFLLAPKID